MSRLDSPAREWPPVLGGGSGGGVWRRQARRARGAQSLPAPQAAKQRLSGRWRERSDHRVETQSAPGGALPLSLRSAPAPPPPPPRERHRTHRPAGSRRASCRTPTASALLPARTAGRLDPAGGPGERRALASRRRGQSPGAAPRDRAEPWDNGAAAAAARRRGTQSVRPPAVRPHPRP